MKRSFNILLLALALSPPAWADYNLWTGGDSGSYTDSSKWTATTGTETGKWVKSGPVTFTDSSLNLNGAGNNQLTIDGAAGAVSITTNFNIATSGDTLGGSLTVQNNGSFTTTGTTWIGKNSQTGYLNVASGGTVNIVGGYFADAANATAVVRIDGGTLKNTSTLHFAHHGAAELYITNGGKWDAAGNLRLGGDNNSNVVRASAKVEIGSLTDESNSGSIVAANELWIGTGSSATVNLFRGTIDAKTLSIGSQNYGTLIVDKGTVTVTETLTVGPSGTMKTNLDSNRTRNELIINDGGTVKATTLQTGTDGNKDNYIEINPGGVLEVSNNVYHANSGAGKDEIVVNGGQYRLSEGSTGTLSFGHHGYTKLTISNGGVIEENKITFAANTSGRVDMLLTGEGSKLSSTDTGYQVILNAGEYTVTDGAIFSVAKGTLSIGHQDYTKLTISNGGVIEGNKIAFAANTNGRVDMLLTGEGSKLSSTDTGYLVNLNAGEYTITDGAKFSVADRLYLNSTQGVTTLNVTNKGEVHAAAGFWANKSAANETNINVSSGGLLSIAESSTANLISYIADASGGTVNWLIDGGTVTSKSNLRTGHHGTLNLTVTNGGKIETTSMELGAGDAGSKGVGTLYLSGSDSLIKTSGAFTVGNNSEGHLYFLASATGMGKIEAGSFVLRTSATTTGKANTISLGVDHGLTGITNYPDDGYEILSTTGAITNWKVDDLGIWKVAKTDKSVVATLNTDYKLASDLIMNSTQPIDLSSLPTKGFANIEGAGNDDYILRLSFTGLNTLNDAETFANWISDSVSGLTATALSETRIEISGFHSNESILTWDLSTAPIAGVQIASAAGQSVPEPATWVLLILGCAGVWYLRKNRSGK